MFTLSTQNRAKQEVQCPLGFFHWLVWIIQLQCFDVGYFRTQDWSSCFPVNGDFTIIHRLLTPCLHFYVKCTSCQCFYIYVLSFPWSNTVCALQSSYRSPSVLSISLHNNVSWHHRQRHIWRNAGKAANVWNVMNVEWASVSKTWIIVQVWQSVYRTFWCSLKHFCCVSGFQLQSIIPNCYPS